MTVTSGRTTTSNVMVRLTLSGREKNILKASSGTAVRR